MGSNISAAPKDQNILDTLRFIDGGHMVLDLDTACLEVIEACQEEKKKGTVTLKLVFDPDAKTGAMRISGEIATKAPKAKPMASLFFVTPEGRLSRQDPRQHEMFPQKNAATDPRTGVVHSSEEDDRNPYNGGMY